MKKWEFIALIREDFQTVFVRDPAIKSAFHLLTLHTGFWAVFSYRWQHALYQAGFHWLARWFSLFSRLFTGVEIHPAVKAGRRLFIDHGMGIVIGETAELGDDVSIYQGVTLGGTTWEAVKRHPTIGNNVIIGAGAKVLGAITIGDNVRIGSNAVVVKDVEAQQTVVGVPAKAIRKNENLSFIPYACTNMNDPQEALLKEKIKLLEEKIKILEAQLMVCEDEKS